VHVRYSRVRCKVDNVNYLQSTGTLLYLCREGNGCNTDIVGLEISYFHLTELSSVFRAFRAVIGSVLVQYHALQ
jgi:hypothetical protein